MLYPWQQNQWQQLARLLASKQVPHAILLQGNEGLGKLALAQQLAHAVLCQQPLQDQQACGKCPSCKLLAANTHPDFYHLKPTAKENSTSKKPALSIRIEHVRELCEKLNQTSQLSGYRVAIIDQAEGLTLSAANSLLKTLEEPGRNVLIILVSARPQRLPVTIRSRCQSLHIKIPENTEALSWLSQQLPDKQTEQLQQTLNYAHGSPLTAIDYIDDFEQIQLISEAMTAQCQDKDSLEYALKLAKYSKVKTLEAMTGWVCDLSKIITCGQDAKIINEQYRKNLIQIAKRADSKRVFRFHEQLNFNLLHSSIAVNEQLLWENLLLSWDNL